MLRAKIDHAGQIEGGDEPSQFVRHAVAIEADDGEAPCLVPEIPE